MPTDVTDERPERAIPDATVARLPVYLRVFSGLVDRGTTTASSQDLATAAGVNPAQLRKDLSYLGSYGTRGVGYDVDYLRYQISRELGLTQDWPILIAGVGSLGQALLRYDGFRSRGFRVVALLDRDPEVVGRELDGVVVDDVADLAAVVAARQVAIGVITTPAAAAADVAAALVEAGVRSILNFAPVVLSVPDEVKVRRVDLSIELQILAYHEQRAASEVVGS